MAHGLTNSLKVYVLPPGCRYLVIDRDKSTNVEHASSALCEAIRDKSVLVIIDSDGGEDVYVRFSDFDPAPPAS